MICYFHLRKHVKLYYYTYCQECLENPNINTKNSLTKWDGYRWIFLTALSSRKKYEQFYFDVTKERNFIFNIVGPLSDWMCHDKDNKKYKPSYRISYIGKTNKTKIKYLN